MPARPLFPTATPCAQPSVHRRAAAGAGAWHPGGRCRSNRVSRGCCALPRPGLVDQCSVRAKTRCCRRAMRCLLPGPNMWCWNLGIAGRATRPMRPCSFHVAPWPHRHHHAPAPPAIGNWAWCSHARTGERWLALAGRRAQLQSRSRQRRGGWVQGWQDLPWAG